MPPTPHRNPLVRQLPRSAAYGAAACRLVARPNPKDEPTEPQHLELLFCSQIVVTRRHALSHCGLPACSPPLRLTPHPTPAISAGPPHRRPALVGLSACGERQYTTERPLGIHSTG